MLIQSNIMRFAHRDSSMDDLGCSGKINNAFCYIKFMLVLLTVNMVVG